MDNTTPPVTPNPSTPPADNPMPASGTFNKLLKIILVIGTIILVVAVGAYTFTRHNSKKTTSSSQTHITESPESGKQTESELNDFKQEVTVEISADGISPQVLHISKDTRINWINKDKVVHKLAITPGDTVPPQFDNDHQIDVGGGYPYVIHQSITFHYYVVDKPIHSATVIVK